MTGRGKTKKLKELEEQAAEREALKEKKAMKSIWINYVGGKYERQPTEIILSKWITIDKMKSNKAVRTEFVELTGISNGLVNISHEGTILAGNAVLNDVANITYETPLIITRVGQVQSPRHFKIASTDTESSCLLSTSQSLPSHADKSSSLTRVASVPYVVHSASPSTQVTSEVPQRSGHLVSARSIGPSSFPQLTGSRRRREGSEGVGSAVLLKNAAVSSGQSSVEQQVSRQPTSWRTVRFLPS